MQKDKVTLGKFISFEGLDGSGKSTQVDLLYNYLHKHYPEITVHKTYEPGGGGISLTQKIREITSNSFQYNLCNLSHLLLNTVSRLEHSNQFILPKLKKSECIICDRFFDSTIAYQVYGQELSLDLAILLKEKSIGNLTPDKTIFLDLPVEHIHKRCTQRSTQDYYEKLPLEFFYSVREGYLSLINQYPDRFIIINALDTPESIFVQIKDNILPLLTEV